MSTVLSIARTEARRIFVSPLAWAVLACLQIVLGFVFWASVVGFINSEMTGNSDNSFGVTDVVSGTLLGFPMILMLLVMPLMTMRLFAEERRSGSIILLFSAPASLIEIVLGKFLGLVSFMLATLVLLAIMPLTLLSGTHLDLGFIAAGLLGLFLMMLAFGSAGLFVSTLTREPTIAAVLSFGLLLLVWLIQVPATISRCRSPAPVRNYLSLITHFGKPASRHLQHGGRRLLRAVHRVLPVAGRAAAGYRAQLVRDRHEQSPNRNASCCSRSSTARCSSPWSSACSVSCRCATSWKRTGPPAAATPSPPPARNCSSRCRTR